jgi:N-acetylglucosamine kinase-like BadF-type ATPase
MNSGAAAPVVVAVDGGGSKTDAVALTRDGELVGRGQAPGSSPHFEGVAGSVEAVDAAVRRAADGHPIELVHLYVSGLDLPVELETYRAALVECDWAMPGTVVENDLYALLRSGAEEPDAVAVVCGTGINAVGVRADGVTVRYPALGPISGDWGGGSGLGEVALWHAARDVDGRGPHTSLTAAVVEGMGVDSVQQLIEDLHFGRRGLPELAVLAPAVFRVADEGDAIAQGIVDQQADEIVVYATTTLTRLELLDRPVPVVLGGGVIRARHPRLMSRIESELARRAPRATLRIVDAPPILGAALLTLEAANAAPEAVLRAASALA